MALARVLGGKELRSRWRGLVLLGLLTALWAGATMTAVAGARRTASVVDRFQRETLASDARFSISGDRDGDELLAALDGAPEVEGADLMWFASTGLAFDRGAWVLLFGATRGSWGRDFDLPVVVRGRTAAPTSATEVTVTEATAKLLNVDVGDHIAVPTWDRQEYEAWWITRGRYLDFNGPLIDVVVVGVVELATSLESTVEDSLLIIATPAFLERWQSSIAREERYVVAAMADDNLDIDEFAEGLSSRVGATVRAQSAEQAYAASLRDATGALTIGLLVLAILVGLVGAAVVGLGVAREVRRAAVRNQPLRALGATPAQRVWALSLPIAVVGGAAAALAIVGSIVASARFPIGPGHNAEAVRGIWIDTPVVAGAGLAVGFMLLVAAAAALRPEAALTRQRVAKTSGAPIFRSLGPAARVGYRNAVGATQARATVLIAAVTLAGLIGAMWFVRSLDTLGADESRWGYTWSSSPEYAVAAAEAEQLMAVLIEHPDVESVGYLENAVVTVDGVSVPITAIYREAGPVLSPVVLAGRLPTSSFDIALGENTARELGLSVGDQMLIDSSFAPPETFIVVGLVVPPYTGSESDPGVGMLTTGANMQRLAIPFESTATFLLIKYREGADVQRVEADLTDIGFRFEVRSHARVPRGLANVLGARVIVVWLGWFFLLLGFLATLLAAIRQRARHARDFEILRALGFDRRDIGRCVTSEVATIVAVGLLVGVPIGLIVGSQAWRLTVGNLGVVDAQPSPLVPALALICVALVATLGSAALGRRMVSRGAADRARSFQHLQS